MKRILILTIMLSFFGFGKSNAQKNTPDKTVSSEEPKGVIGKYYEDDLPVIMKFVDGIPENGIISKFPYLTVVSWKYDKSENNGMPLDKVNQRMIALEDAIENAMTSTKLFTHVYSRTGNGLKEFAYYATSQDDFMGMLNKALEEHDEYPIGIDFYEDKEWTDFKKILANFAK